MSIKPVKRKRVIDEDSITNAPILIKKYDPTKPPPASVMDYVHEKIKEGATLDEAIASMLIPPSVYRAWLEDYPDFAILAQTAYYQSQAWYTAKLRERIADNSGKTNSSDKLLVWALENLFGIGKPMTEEADKAKSLGTLTATLEITGKKDERVEVGDLTDEELELMKKIKLKGQTEERTAFDESDIEAEVIEEEEEE